ncbi:MAG: HAMP domain-containing histidine kinase [Bacteroidales bacterium]|jgi:signal transduction histidine kinase|nr:HAMP domain-containing histidine kinase [Bacteroidales bacterium]
MTVAILIGVGSLVLGVLAGVFFTMRRNAKKINFLMDAIEDGEMNFRFDNKTSINRALNRMRDIISKVKRENESESWSKLIRVLTHEIMNTVTPIAVLSESLAEDENLDTKAGLATIAESSRNLINFVNSYRSLSKIARPVKRPIIVKELIDSVMELNAKYLEENGVQCTARYSAPDILIYADYGQISQILINLIKNAVQAESRSIIISVELSPKDEVIIRVKDDGVPITKENTDQIFIPFYTTKEGGSGIGLSLSRQIMRLHNGTLDLEQSDEQMTVFVMKFL